MCSENRLPSLAVIGAGLDLAEAFHREVLEPLVGDVPHAACLLGEGSEVLGFDTQRSRDHEWGPRAQVLVAAADVEEVAARIDGGLPDTFRGLPTRWTSLAEGGAVAHHVEVTTLEAWLARALGFDPREGIDTAAWLAVPQQRLLEVVCGRVFRDEPGELTRVRALLAWYPPDVWRWMMASAWRLVWAAQPSRARCLETGDALGERLLAARLCRLSMDLAFLQERRYHPYEKWYGAAFDRLDAAPTLRPLLAEALGPSDPAATTDVLAQALTWLGERQNALGLCAPVAPAIGPFAVGIGDAVRPYALVNAGDYARALREAIADAGLRELIPVGAVDQLTHADDGLVTHSDWPRRLERSFRALLDAKGD